MDDLVLYQIQKSEGTPNKLSEMDDQVLYQIQKSEGTPQQVVWYGWSGPHSDPNMGHEGYITSLYRVLWVGTQIFSYELFAREKLSSRFPPKYDENKKCHWKTKNPIF